MRAFDIFKKFASNLFKPAETQKAEFLDGVSSIVERLKQDLPTNKITQETVDRAVKIMIDTTEGKRMVIEASAFMMTDGFTKSSEFLPHVATNGIHTSVQPHLVHAIKNGEVDKAVSLIIEEARKPQHRAEPFPVETLKQ